MLRNKRKTAGQFAGVLRELDNTATACFLLSDANRVASKGGFDPLAARAVLTENTNEFETKRGYF